ncbi:DUF4401 domain-containing protein [Tenacibaculum sp. Bg11-29]|uniref:DUF4401 domain-containing protein n=1 Tax=Tenacibaculum sp. Bg11-29 TaxID=2058306 RepID=UPI000C334B18|nr:DUF4401 domain-containing protein [Tenacibaculum sp. Bg11-29]PKH51984.1 DUF4401 domain-containing protein [Tenacibaculum sp. Bg11-29]
MEKLINKKEILDRVRFSEGENFQYDEEAILKEFKIQEDNNSSLAIKILSIFGGILATIAFIAFLLIAGLYNSEIGLVLFGFIFIVSAILLNKIYDKLIIDTFSVSSYVIGNILLVFGLTEMNFDENIISGLICLIAISSLFITQNYILSFIAILTVNCCFLYLITFYHVYDIIHLYIGLSILILTYLFLNEAKLIATNIKISKLYAPCRIGFIISLLIGLIAFDRENLFFISQNNIWLSSITLIIVNIYLVYIILKIIEVKTLTNKLVIYTLTSLILISLVLAPTILGAITIILLSFLVQYKTGLAIGIISFIYFISQYYYDLNFTLLTKSIILFSSGVLFLLLYIFTNKYLLSDEKV